MGSPRPRPQPRGTQHRDSCGRGPRASPRLRAEVPPKQNRVDPWPLDVELYKRGNAIERLCGRIKRFRRVCTRYGDTDLMFSAFVTTAHEPIKPVDSTSIRCTSASQRGNPLPHRQAAKPARYQGRPTVVLTGPRLGTSVRLFVPQACPRPSDRPPDRCHTGIARRMNSSKRGTVKAVSPWAGLQIIVVDAVESRLGGAIPAGRMPRPAVPAAATP